jgi:hypothetical protein
MSGWGGQDGWDGLVRLAKLNSCQARPSQIRLKRVRLGLEVLVSIHGVGG